MKKVLALILAGGRGKRMGVLCHHRPKPVLPFAGKYRVIDFTLNNCVRSKIEHIAVLVDYQRSSVVSYLEQWHSTNARPCKFDILPPGRDSYSGTADAVFQNLDFLRKTHPEYILILAGDHVYHMDYYQLLAYHISMRADLTLCVVRVHPGQAPHFGIAELDAHGRVITFVEKPDKPQSNLASMGVYVFNTDVLAKRLLDDAAQASSLHDFGYSIIPAMVARERVFAYEHSDYWQDIGTVEAFHQAHMDLLGNRSSHVADVVLHMPKDMQIHLSLSERWEAGNIQNSIVSEDCIVEGVVKNCVLSPGVHISKHTFVRNSVLMDNVFVDRHSLVDTCVIDEEVSIGQFCRIGCRPRSLSGSRGVTVLGRGAAIPPYTTIGANCTIPPATESPALRPQRFSVDNQLSVMK